MLTPQTSHLFQICLVRIPAPSRSFRPCCANSDSRYCSPSRRWLQLYSASNSPKRDHCSTLTLLTIGRIHGARTSRSPGQSAGSGVNIRGTGRRLRDGETRRDVTGRSHVYTRGSPAHGSSFDFISFRTIAYICPARPRLYLAKYDSRSMSFRQGSFLGARAR